MFHESVLQNFAKSTGQYLRRNFFLVNSGITLLFECSPSRASEIEHFKIFSYPRENQPPMIFFFFLFAIALSHFLMLEVFYAYAEE